MTYIPQWDLPSCTPRAPNEKSLPSPFRATRKEKTHSTLSHHLTDMRFVMRRVALAFDAKLLTRFGIRPVGMVGGVRITVMQYNRIGRIYLGTSAWNHFSSLVIHKILMVGASPQRNSTTRMLNSTCFPLLTCGRKKKETSSLGEW